MDFSVLVSKWVSYVSFNGSTRAKNALPSTYHPVPTRYVQPRTCTSIISGIHGGFPRGGLISAAAPRKPEYARRIKVQLLM